MNTLEILQRCSHLLSDSELKSLERFATRSDTVPITTVKDAYVTGIMEDGTLIVVSNDNDYLIEMRPEDTERLFTLLKMHISRDHSIPR